MKLAICDDDRKKLEFMQTLVKAEIDLIGVDCSVDAFRCSAVLQQKLTLEEYDIFFLDVEMPTLNGFEVAATIRKNNKEAIIMFISEDERLAFPSFEYNPYWFLQKEDFPDKVPYVLRKSIQACIDRHIYIDIGDEEKHPVRKDEIQYIECDNHKLSFHLKEGSIYKYGTLAKMEKKLNNLGFMRVHKNYMVNLEHVSYLQLNTVVLISGNKVALSKYKRNILRIRLFLI